MPGPALPEILRSPVVVAPMGGGPSTPDLVVAAARAGAFGFLAGGYKTVAALRADMDAVRAATGEPFGVNVFLPGAPTGDPVGMSAYLESLQGDAAALGVEIGQPAWSDDAWESKVDMLLTQPPAVVSFTFGCPPPEVVHAVQAAGCSVWVTVTSESEAQQAAAAGADCLCVQGEEAGAHRGCFTNDAGALNGHPLVQLLRQASQATGLPTVAAGGIMDHQGVEAALAAGALAVQCGTAFLRCPESGTSPAHRAALEDPQFTATAVTRAFSGRPARGLVNRFIRDHPGAPAAYPEINSATRPLRAAATAAGDVHRMSLWAGTGWRSGRSLHAGEVVQMLLGR
ncbi:MAG: nitronate monooxygenase [Acidimicrobiales bacterium]